MLEDSMEKPLPGSLEGKEGNRVTWLCSNLLQVCCQLIWVLERAHNMPPPLIGRQEAPVVHWPVAHLAESSTLGCC